MAHLYIAICSDDMSSYDMPLNFLIIDSASCIRFFFLMSSAVCLELTGDNFAHMKQMITTATTMPGINICCFILKLLADRPGLRTWCVSQ